MSRTISTTRPPPGPDGTIGAPDLDGRVVDGNESLAQRIRCAFHFRKGEYFPDTDLGLDYILLFGGVVTPAQAAQVMVDVIRHEGRGEVIDITDVEYRLINSTRKLLFSCTVHTIHGALEFDTEIG